MLLFSWNIAGLSTTLKRIYQDYPECSSLEEFFFTKHQADIVCLQEHKIPLSQLQHRTIKVDLPSRNGNNKTTSTTQASSSFVRSLSPSTNTSSKTDGDDMYESFWSCCTDEQQKGLNGVVTFCRKGSVIYADSHPLQIPELDQQGRCLLTDHGNFVLFNVYVPSGGNEMGYRMRFLRALQAAMERQTKPVILTGDLNISRDKHDIFWKNRVVDVNSLIKEQQGQKENKANNDKTTTTAPLWKAQLCEHFPRILQVLETRKVVPTQTRNPQTNAVFQKYRMTVQVPDPDTSSSSAKTVFLGAHESIPEYCEWDYKIEEQTYHDQDLQKDVLVRQANMVSLDVLSELMNKIAKVYWSEETLRKIAEDDICTVNKSSPPRIWLETLLEQKVDVFRLLYPEAKARMTCWNQSKNKRYTNDGFRIDYTIIDPCLLPKVVRSENEWLRTGTEHCQEPSNDRNVFCSERAALCAATSNGLYEEVGYAGGGLKEVSQTTLNTQFGIPHTGMVYTPPAYSDHIAVTLLLEDDVLPRNLDLDAKKSRRSQPHRAQPSIASFFAGGGAKKSSSVGPTTKRFPKATPAAIPSKKPKTSILHHFKGK